MNRSNRSTDRLYSSMRFEGDGVTTRVPLTFDLRKGDGLAVDFGEGLVTEGYIVDFEVTPTVVIFKEPLPKGKTVTIRRLVYIGKVKHVFQWTGNAQGGADFSALNLDENFEQIVRASQDAMDAQMLATETLEEMAGIKDAAIEAQKDSKQYAQEAKERAQSIGDVEKRVKEQAAKAESSAEESKQSAEEAEKWAKEAENVAGFDPSKFREKDDLVFEGSLQIKAFEDKGGGVFLHGKDGKIRGQMVVTDRGLQMTQYPEGTGLQTFTFPETGDGGELLTDGGGKWSMPKESGELALTDSVVKVQDKLSKFGVLTSEFSSLSDALNSGNTHLFIPSGHYKFSEGIVVGADIPLQSLQGLGKVTLDFSESSSGLTFDGKLVDIPEPLEIGSSGTGVITFPSTANISEGDIIILHNPSDFSFSEARKYYTDGFMARVSKVANGKVTIYGTIPEFNRSSIKAYKLANNSPLHLDNLEVIPPKKGIGVLVTARQNVSLGSGMSVANAGYTGVELDRCFDILMVGGLYYANDRDAYPVVLSNCQNFTLDSVKGYSTRHCIGLGGRSGAGSVPVRDGFIANAVFNNDGSLGIGAGDTHGNVVGVTYDNCVFKSGLIAGGTDNTYRNCTVYSRWSPDDGNAIMGGEVKEGGTIYIFNTVINLTATHRARSFGVVHLSAHQSKGFNLIVKGLHINSNVTTSLNAGVVRIVYSGYTPLNMQLDSVTLGHNITVPYLVRVETTGHWSPTSVKSNVVVEKLKLHPPSETVRVDSALGVDNFNVVTY